MTARSIPYAPARPLAALLAALLLLPLGAALLAPPALAEGGQPDLQVVDLQWQPGTPETGQNMTFTATVRNSGNASAGNSTLRFLIDLYHLPPDVQVPALAAGATVNVTSDVWLANGTGQHEVSAYADFDNEVQELNETNNVRSETFNLAAGDEPDLVITALAWLAEDPLAGDEVLIYVNVANLGNATASNSTVVLNLDNASLGLGYTGVLGPNETRNISVLWTATSGNHTVLARADHGNVIAESNEGNNERTAILRIGIHLSDLIIADINVFPDQPAEGDTVEFQITVLNEGLGTSNHTPFELRLDGILLGDSDLGGRSFPGGGVIASRYWLNASRGVHTVEAVADPSDIVPEADESNNRYALTFEVKTRSNGTMLLSDLTVERVRVVPAHPIPGHEAYFVASVRNVGDEGSGPFRTAFFLSGPSGGPGEFVRFPGIAAGEQAEVFSSPFLVRAGVHRLAVAVDTHREVAERDEFNNFRQLSLTFGYPDLRVLEVGVRGGDVAPGEQARFTARVLNEGDLVTSVTVTFGADDGYLGQAHGYLMPGEARTFEAPSVWHAWPGRHVASVTALAGEVELDLKDNYGEHVLEVLRPDPAIAEEDIVVTKREVQTDLAGVPNPAGGVDIAVTLRNLGEGRTWRHGLFASVQVCTHPLAMRYECETLTNWSSYEPFASGEDRTLALGWSTFGKVGDFEVCVRLRYEAEQRHHENDRACTPFFVIVGAGVGSVDASVLFPPTLPPLPQAAALPAPRTYVPKGVQGLPLAP